MFFAIVAFAEAFTCRPTCIVEFTCVFSSSSQNIEEEFPS